MTCASTNSSAKFTALLFRGRRALLVHVFYTIEYDYSIPYSFLS